jgi:kumamolisin
MLNQHLDKAFSEATAIGLPLFISTGDQGSGSLRGQLQDGTEITLYAPGAQASYPATSPYATAVGGTMLYAINGAIDEEVVWNELGLLRQGKYYLGGATGRGVSDRYKQVPTYQFKAYVNLQSVNQPPVTGRAIPDVAGNAGSTTGYLLSQPPIPNIPPVAPVGGTSAAAPGWAALMACVHESPETVFKGKVPVSFFNDFVSGNGTTSCLLRHRGRPRVHSRR